MFKHINKIVWMYRSKQVNTGYNKIMDAYHHERDAVPTKSKWEAIGADNALKEIAKRLKAKDQCIQEDVDILPLPHRNMFGKVKHYNRHTRSAGTISDRAQGKAYAKSLLIKGSGAAIIVEDETEQFVEGVKEAIIEAQQGDLF